jgi:hypothetical protein
MPKEIECLLSKHKALSSNPNTVPLKDLKKGERTEGEKWVNMIEYFLLYTFMFENGKMKLT